jgi:outer membrane murein-binding lipoprotein Lpp
LARRRFVYIVAGLFLICILVSLILVDVDSEQRISKLDTTVNGLNSTVNELNKSVDELNATVKELNATVNDVNSTVNDLNATANGLEENGNALNSNVNALENRVEALENKSWHVDGNFALTPSNSIVTVNTQGEEWRMNYTFDGTNISGITIVYNLRVTDATGNIVGGLNGIELADLKNSGKGILYIPDEQGTYSVEMRNITGSYIFAFEAQSYY